MKILQLNKAYYPIIGGVEKVVQDIAESLHTDVLCCNDKFATEIITEDSYTLYKAATLIRLFSTPLSLRFITLLSRLHQNYDVIHVHHPDPMSALALFLVRPKAKIVLHWHSDILRQKLLLKLYSPIQSWLLKRSDRIIATTPAYINTSTYLHPFKDKCVAVPIGIVQKQTDPAMLESLFRQYAGKKIVFSLGRFVYYKGFEYLIKAAHNLDNSYIVIIGGDGPFKRELEDYVHLHNLESKVILPGKIEEKDLGAYFAASTIFCLSSIEKTEAFGIVQIEAMSFGKPVVATLIEGSGVPWVNQHGQSGLNVPIKDPEKIAAAIKTICDNSDIYAKFSHNARQRFLTYFSLSSMAENIQKVYDQLYVKDQ